MNKPTQQYASIMKNKLQASDKRRGGAFASPYGKTYGKAPKMINNMGGWRRI